MKKKKDKMDYSTMTTLALLELLVTTPKGQTFNAIMTEIMREDRRIPNDYTDADLRGGLSPTRRP
jgi:hypothetical protein